MSARTGQDYLNGLKASTREMWLGGERVEGVTDHPLLAPGAQAIAAYYDLQHQHPDELLIPDPETGEAINITHMQPRSIEDLHRRHVGLTRISELSMGVMGRTPDYMNVTFAGFADDRTRWAGPDERNAAGFENIVAFQKRLRRNDLSLTHTIIHPTVDKVKDSSFPGNPVPLHKVGETADSIIVRGCRLLATLAPYADEQTVYPAAPLPPDASDYALSFTVAMDTPGLVFLCRDSAIRSNVNPVDAPFSTRFDEQDALCIFDNVEIPKRNVFIDGDLDVYNKVMGKSMWWPNIMQQTTIRALTKLEFAYGLLVRMAEAVNDTSERTMEMLGEVLCYIEVTRNAILLSELNATTWEGGGVYPEARALHPMRALLPDWFTRVNDIIKTVGSHNLLAAASSGAFDNPRINALMNEFQPGANGIRAADRSAVYRVAWDFTGSLLGSRNELYERNYLTSAKTNRMNFHRTYSEANRQRGNELVEKLLSDARGR
jgi:4-hydroxyphenylacetate 3-monooxygenase